MLDRVLASARDRLATLRLARAYRRVYATADGKRVLDDLMTFGGLLKTSFVAEEQRPEIATVFNEGRRRVALRIAHMLRLREADLVSAQSATEEDPA